MYFRVPERLNEFVDPEDKLLQDLEFAYQKHDFTKLKNFSTTILIHGPTGIGKQSLMTEFVYRRLQGCTVLWLTGSQEEVEDLIVEYAEKNMPGFIKRRKNGMLLKGKGFISKILERIFHQRTIIILDGAINPEITIQNMFTETLGRTRRGDILHPCCFVLATEDLTDTLPGTNVCISMTPPIVPSIQLSPDEQSFAEKFGSHPLMIEFFRQLRHFFPEFNHQGLKSQSENMTENFYRLCDLALEKIQLTERSEDIQQILQILSMLTSQEISKELLVTIWQALNPSAGQDRLNQALPYLKLFGVRGVETATISAPRILQDYVIKEMGQGVLQSRFSNLSKVDLMEQFLVHVDPTKLVKELPASGHDSIILGCANVLKGKRPASALRLLSTFKILDELQLKTRYNTTTHDVVKLQWECYLNSRKYDEGVALIDLACEAARQVDGQNSIFLGQLKLMQAESLFYADKTDKAIEVCREYLKQCPETERLRLRENLCYYYISVGNSQAASELQIHLHNYYMDLSADAKQNLSRNYFKLRKYNEALPLIREAHEIRLSLHERESEKVQETERFLTQMLQKTGSHAEAIAIALARLEILEKRYDNKHNIILSVKQEIADLLREKSLLLTHEVLACRGFIYGKEDMQTLIAGVNSVLSGVQLNENSTLEKAVGILTTMYNNVMKNPEIISKDAAKQINLTFFKIARELSQHRQFEKACEILRVAQKLHKEKLGMHPDTAEVNTMLAKHLWDFYGVEKQIKYEYLLIEALSLNEEALKIYEEHSIKNSGEYESKAIRTRNSIVVVLNSLNKQEQAVEMQRKHVEILSGSPLYGPDHEYTKKNMNLLEKAEADLERTGMYS